MAVRAGQLEAFLGLLGEDVRPEDYARVAQVRLLQRGQVRRQLQGSLGLLGKGVRPEDYARLAEVRLRCASFSVAMPAGQLGALLGLLGEGVRPEDYVHVAQVCP